MYKSLSYYTVNFSLEKVVFRMGVNFLFKYVSTKIFQYVLIHFNTQVLKSNSNSFEFFSANTVEVSSILPNSEGLVNL